MRTIVRSAVADAEPPRMRVASKRRVRLHGAVALSLAPLGLAGWERDTLEQWLCTGLRIAASATMGVALGVIFLGATTAAAPTGHGPIAVAFSPWTDEDAAVERIRRAGGLALEASAEGAAPILGAAGLHLAVGGGEEFRRALRREGALFMIDGPAIRGLF